MSNEIKVADKVSVEDILKNMDLLCSAMKKMPCPTTDEMIVKAKMFAEFGGEEVLLRIEERLDYLERRNIFKRFYRWLKGVIG